jgi:hypothetical protein
MHVIDWFCKWVSCIEYTLTPAHDSRGALFVPATGDTPPR